jgi:predicted DNA-binding ribbon-helix-helix protein
LPDRRARFKTSRRLHGNLEKRPASADRIAMHGSAIVKRSVRIAGHPTSISLEAAFWRGLCDIAAARRMSVNALVAAIDARRDGNLSSAIRLFVLDSARGGELTRPQTDARLAPST